MSIQYQELDIRNQVDDKNVNQMKNQNKSNQLRALLYKNISNQTKQVGTNICQIITPLICLMLVFIIKEVASTQLQGFSFSMPIPIMFNLPIVYSLLNTNAAPITINNCNQWYMFDFDETSSQATKNYVGQNDGINPGSGLLKNTYGGYNCNFNLQNQTSISRDIPYFQQPQQVLFYQNYKNQSINQALHSEMLYLNTQPFKINKDIIGNEVLPDGAILFKEASDEKISIRIQVNDLKLAEYHRNNGVTKFMQFNPILNKYYQHLIVPEGQLSVLDLVSRAYLRNLNNSIWLISGSQYMPAESSENDILSGIINLSGATLYPLSLSLLLPVFMFTLVQEKEERQQ